MKELKAIGPGKIEKTVTKIDSGGRLDVWLATVVDGRSRSSIRKWIDEGLVTVNGKGAKPSHIVEQGDYVVVEIPETVSYDVLPEEIPLTIVYQDFDICIVDKPPGLVVHPAQGHFSGTLVNALLHHIGDLSGIGGVAKPGIVHRLDKGTSGLMVICKNDKAHLSLAGQFSGREVKKTYLGIAYGAIKDDKGVFDTMYGRNPGDRMKFSSKVLAGKRAITKWRIVERLEGATLFEADLLTGRTHQIRVHFADSGHPLLGDLAYGASRRVRIFKSSEARKIVEQGERVMLHAAALSFRHPSSGDMVSFKSPIPPDMQHLIDILKNKYLKAVKS